jgi:Heterokaryon incompatibility protein (HET)
MSQSDTSESVRPEPAAQDPDIYDYRSLESDTSLRILTLHGGEGANLIICELNEFGAKMTDRDVRNKSSENGGVTPKTRYHPLVLPGQFSRTPTSAIFVQDEPPEDQDTQDSGTLIDPIPEYEALSWCWGDDSGRSPVDLRIREKNEAGQWRSYRMEIPWTLAEALRALRYPGNDRRLWVDSICIDQGNVDERNRQVQMMAQIYSNASQVCIWLGPATKESEQALSFIRDNVIKLWKFDDLCAKQESSKDWKVFLDLMNRP